MLFPQIYLKYIIETITKIGLINISTGLITNSIFLYIKNKD
jgi:hypothetical protein